MINSNRYIFVGAHVTEATKVALRCEAKAQGVSMSLLVSLAIIEMLERKGYDLSKESVCAVSSDIFPKR